VKKVHTVVEIFDSVNLRNNIMAPLLFDADRTILLYQKSQWNELEGVCAILHNKKPDIRIEKIQVNVKECRNVLTGLYDRLETEGDTVLTEINGGHTVVANFARECCRKRGYACILLDCEGGHIVSVEHAQELEGSVELTPLSFSEILMLQGRIYNRNMHMLAEDKYFPQILAMSEYGFLHQSDFKSFYDFVHSKSNGVLSEQGAEIVLPKTAKLSVRIMRIFELLEEKGFIKNLDIGKSEIRFDCVAPFVKEMLAVKGSWLELYIFILAKQSGLFTEVYQSVMIGWDLERKPRFNVENEIDVVLMKEGRPIFVSCKMTCPKPDDLNEIYALANSFGGYGAIPVLATSYNVRKRNITLWNRAKEMGVLLIDYEELNREGLRSIFEKI